MPSCSSRNTRSSGSSGRIPPGPPLRGTPPTTAGATSTQPPLSPVPSTAGDPTVLSARKRPPRSDLATSTFVHVSTAFSDRLRMSGRGATACRRPGSRRGIVWLRVRQTLLLPSAGLSHLPRKSTGSLAAALSARSSPLLLWVGRVSYNFCTTLHNGRTCTIYVYSVFIVICSTCANTSQIAAHSSRVGGQTRASPGALIWHTSWEENRQSASER